MKNDVKNKMTRSLCKAKFKVKKHSPEILVVAGVIGTVTSAVMACRATTKLSKILEEAKETEKKISEGVESGYIADQEYTEEDGKKDLRITKVQTGLKVVKLYAPAVILGGLSITAMLTSNNILRKRNVSLAAAYAAVDKSFKEYRGRVKERFGEELDKELRYNIKAKEIEEVVKDEKTGKEKVQKKIVNVSDFDDCSEYAKFYDCGCTGWTKDPELNLLFLRKQQDYLNNRLKANGYLFLNDVYEALGIQKTKIGQIAGWVYDEKNPVGDNYIDFGIYDTHREANRRFVNGLERTILLDFNCDGDILDMM